MSDQPNRQREGASRCETRTLCALAWGAPLVWVVQWLAWFVVDGRIVWLLLTVLVGTWLASLRPIAGLGRHARSGRCRSMWWPRLKPDTAMCAASIGFPALYFTAVWV